MTNYNAIHSLFFLISVFVVFVSFVCVFFLFYCPLNFPSSFPLKVYHFLTCNVLLSILFARFFIKFFNLLFELSILIAVLAFVITILHRKAPEKILSVRL